jgi:hypothetical protein
MALRKLEGQRLNLLERLERLNEHVPTGTVGTIETGIGIKSLSDIVSQLR